MHQLPPETHTDIDVDPAELARIALTVAVEAGRLVVDERPVGLGVAETKSSATDVVTVMDQRSRDHLLARLGELRPRDGFAGEERGARASDSGITRVVDPIDGTVNYLYEIPAYAVSVAAAVGDPGVDGAWQPVAGAVVNPVTGERYTAWAGGGAWRSIGDAQPRRLQVRETSLGQALCGTGFGYDADRRAWQAAVLSHVLPQVRDIRRLGSAALDLCRVAEGSLDVYYERGLNPWDMAAGWLVATEAGALVSDLHGRAPGAELTLAGAPVLHSRPAAVPEGAIEQVGPEIVR
ncbi:inositol monophosphatase family protein [Janibacter limosus]|uniref:Inositol monophosphatase n=1 Tax=Janibacter limosus TaxID=53458 RepID=A0AC61U838_9MICO|nr:inositol monophosphatase family protein [Janibacter limosus]UUZ46068.1 inositol monophosphatase family protein [Janibacter limosus]